MTAACAVNMHCETGRLATQLWTNLYSVEITSDECLMKVQALLSSRSNMDVARSFQGSEAQTFIDLLEWVLSRPLLDDKLRQRGLLLLSKICKARRIIPTSYVLRQELIRVGTVHRRGGFADVRNGEYPDFKFPVAVKRLKTNEGDSDRIFKRLCREVIGWKHLSHPNLLPLLGVSVSLDQCCFHILTEWLSNGNVMEHTKSNPDANRMRLLSEVASGVAFLHKIRVVHGDLKGANILVDDAGAARVADFGLMTMADLSTVLLSETAVSFGGTFSWMSPELLLDSPPGSNGRPTRESDCYALGMVIYEVLTGCRPFHHLYGLKSIPAVLRGERPNKPPGAESLGFSSELWGLVELCWRESSSARPTARRLFDYLSTASLTWVPSPVYPATEVSAEGTADSDSSGSLGASLADFTGKM